MDLLDKLSSIAEMLEGNTIEEHEAIAGFYRLRQHLTQDRLAESRQQLEIYLKERIQIEERAALTNFSKEALIRLNHLAKRRKALLPLLSMSEPTPQRNTR
jgi:hypothetical protein